MSTERWLKRPDPINGHRFPRLRQRMRRTGRSSQEKTIVQVKDIAAFAFTPASEPFGSATCCRAPFSVAQDNS